MKRCPRCRSTLLLDLDDVPGSHRAIWKCIGCGRETLFDEQEQSEDERILENIRQAQPQRT